MENNKNSQILYFDILKDNVLFFALNNNFYKLDLINNLLTKQEDSLFKNEILNKEFNFFDKTLLLENDVLIIKTNLELLNVIPAFINEEMIVQAKNISAKSFTLDSNFLVNKVAIIAANKLELAYFKKYILTNELRGLNVKYQELLYLLKNEYVKYFQIKINNILISKLTNKLIQLTYQDINKNNFQAYETYSYYLNIDDFFLIYETFISEDFYHKITNDLEQQKTTIYLKAIESSIVLSAVYCNDDNIIYKYQDKIYHLIDE